MNAYELVQRLLVIMEANPNSYGKDKDFASTLAELNLQLIILFKRGSRFSYNKMRVVPFPAAATINKLIRNNRLESYSYEQAMQYIYTNATAEYREKLLKKLYIGRDLEILKDSYAMILNLYRSKMGQEYTDNQILFENHLAIQCMLGLSIGVQGN